MFAVSDTYINVTPFLHSFSACCLCSNFSFWLLLDCKVFGAEVSSIRYYTWLSWWEEIEITQIKQEITAIKSTPKEGYRGTSCIYYINLWLPSFNQFHFQRWKEKLCVTGLFFKPNSQTQPFGLQRMVYSNIILCRAPEKFKWIGLNSRVINLNSVQFCWQNSTT